MEKIVCGTRTTLRTSIKRGLKFIYESSRDAENFALYGYDYLACFESLASTAKDGDLQRVARNMGRERAVIWRRDHTDVPNNADGNDIACLVIGDDAADRLGLANQTFRVRLREAASAFTACDFLGFDPKIEPPPKDIPDLCECGTDNERGQTCCHACGESLPIWSSYAVWLDALIYSYMGDRCGVRLGASFGDVIKWLPMMRNYPSPSDDEDDYYWAVYAITHVIYTLNDYGSYKLARDWLPQEFAFLKRNLKTAIAAEDAESIGEFLDTLKCFGLTEVHPLIASGVEFLLATQNSDGSWGDSDSEDPYQRYHPTLTAIDGLRDYEWRGRRLSFPNLLPALIDHRRKEVAPLCVGQ